EKEAPMLKVWGRRSSFNVQKVLWLVGELGLAHEHIPAGGDFGRLDERVEPARTRAGDRGWRSGGVGIPRHPQIPGRPLRSQRIVVRRSRRARARRSLDGLVAVDAPARFARWRL